MIKQSQNHPSATTRKHLIYDVDGKFFLLLQESTIWNGHICCIYIESVPKTNVCVCIYSKE